MAKQRRYESEQFIRASLEEVFEFFSNAENLEALTPDFLRFKILSDLPIEMKEGAIIRYSLSLFGVPVKWKTRISEWAAGSHFVDEQEKGPFALWRHKHEFFERDGGVLMKDTVDYRAPLGVLGQLAHSIFVTRLVHRIFEFRRSAIETHLSA